MSESLSAWLSLREPADAAARSASLTRAVVEKLPRERPPRIVDLGTGTGSNVRYLARHLSGESHWLLVDRDPVLLSEASRALKSLEPLVVETREMNLGALDASLFAGRDLVTASALLDLVSETWLRELANACRATGAAALFALTYNGRSRCDPVEPEDAMICELLNRHQKNNDKGFGRAAGPDAAAIAEQCFAGAGYDVRREPSDWVLPPEAGELQRQLVDGWAEAAREIAPEHESMIADWRRRRLSHIESRRSHIIVGHDDLAATVFPDP